MLDATCVAHMYWHLHPGSFQVEGKRKGTKCKMAINDVPALHSEAIWAELFFLPCVPHMQRTHHLRFSLQTDGMSMAFGYGRWHRYVPNKKRKTGDDDDEDVNEPRHKQGERPSPHPRPRPVLLRRSQSAHLDLERRTGTPTRHWAPRVWTRCAAGQSKQWTRE